MTFEVPATIEQAADAANILGELAIAATWKRSAIVRAFCEHGKPGPKGDRMESQTISLREFSRLGIVGLRDINTVRRYYDAWDATGLPEPEPGKTTELPPPELAFPASTSKPVLERAENHTDSPASASPDDPAWPDDDEIAEGEIIDDDPPGCPVIPWAKIVREMRSILSGYAKDMPAGEAAKFAAMLRTIADKIDTKARNGK